jgi:hypothetical protein
MKREAPEKVVASARALLLDGWTHEQAAEIAIFKATFGTGRIIDPAPVVEAIRLRKN